jgi:hypothetical protein
VTGVKWLSSYFPGLAGTPGDTLVYIMDGTQPGGTMVVAGGTHGNEIAGIMSATVLVESARVKKGRLIVIPHANNSAITYTDPDRPGPSWIDVETKSGLRHFRYGSRRTRLDQQGEADPARYLHPSGKGEAIEGEEARNLDRAHPGRADGNLTQRIAYGMLELLKKENATIAFDLHEAGPTSRLAWMIVANPKNVDYGAVAVLNLEAMGIDMKLEPSAENFPGLSHREWGDATKAMSFLIETPNPGQVDDPRGKDVENDPVFPLWKRVGVHLDTVREILGGYNETAGKDEIVIDGVPGLTDMQQKGLGAYLN